LKRLIRKAEIDYNQFLDNLLNSTRFSNSEVDSVISNNPNCVFSGEVYRALYFDEVDMEYALKQSEKIADTKDAKTLTGYVISELISIDNSYQSFSKNMDGIEFFHKSELSHNSSSRVIIKINATNGLDVNLLVNKYKDKVDYAEFSEFSSENEVLVKFNDIYEIIDDSEIYEKIKELINN